MTASAITRTFGQTIGQGFKRDEKGSVGVIFGLMTATVVMFCGVAIDIGRAAHSNARIGESIDSAALAAAKGMRLEGLSDTDAVTLAQNVFNQNMASSSGRWTNINSVNVTTDRTTYSVSISVDASVSTAFAGIIGINTLPLSKSGTAIFDLKDIEVAVQLDLTGSMCNPCSKITALRSASAELVNTLLPDGGTPNVVRVSLAPFAQTVNAGTLAAAVSNRTSTGCVLESNAVDPNTDAAPTNVNYLTSSGGCPTSSQPVSGVPMPAVVPLTTDKTTLLNEVSNYQTYGSTAGQLGTSWAWYTLSPQWSSILPSSSQPAAYSDKRTKKVAILMTDGVYNTVGGVDAGDTSYTATASQTRAKAMCDGMKADGITIYTVGFDLSVYRSSEPGPYANAVALLNYCASAPGDFYQAENTSDLNAAFKSIATNIMTLRLAQ